MRKETPSNMPWHIMNDGKRVRFDWVGFHEEVDKRAREHLLSKTEIYRKITRLLHPEYSEDDVEENYPEIRKWDGREQAANGPKDLLEICKPLGAFFGCEEGRFLLYEDISEEPQKSATEMRETSAPASGWMHPADISQIEKAMEHIKKKEAAHELYGILVDLIVAYLLAEEDFWSKYGAEVEGQDDVVAYPKRISVEIAIRKSSPYLPKELRYRLEALLEDMFGQYEGIWPEGNGNSQKFLELKERQFEEYMKRYELDFKEYNSIKGMVFQAFMVHDEESELFERLDSIFSNYLCD